MVNINKSDRFLVKSNHFITYSNTTSFCAWTHHVQMVSIDLFFLAVDNRKAI